MELPPKCTDNQRHFDSILLLSGGLDSSILLYYLRMEQGERPLALHLGGLASHFEQKAAEELASESKTHLRVVDVSSFMNAIADTSLSPSQQGHRVAFANAVVFSIAMALALEHQIDSVSVALTEEDAKAYIENRRRFLSYMEEGVKLIDRECRISTPFLEWNKADVISKGAELRVPFEKTWSCTRPLERRHDGRCSSCRSRMAGFANSGVPDPTVYAIRNSTSRRNSDEH